MSSLDDRLQRQLDKVQREREVIAQRAADFGITPGAEVHDGYRMWEREETALSRAALSHAGVIAQQAVLHGGDHGSVWVEWAKHQPDPECPVIEAVWEPRNVLRSKMKRVSSRGLDWWKESVRPIYATLREGEVMVICCEGPKLSIHVLVPEQYHDEDPNVREV